MIIPGIGTSIHVRESRINRLYLAETYWDVRPASLPAKYDRHLNMWRTFEYISHETLQRIFDVSERQQYMRRRFA